METIITTVIWAAIIQGLFLVGLYLFSKKHRSTANTLLGAFLFLFIYEAILQFIPYNEIGDYSLNYFSFPEIKLLYGVLFFHYLLEKVNRTAAYWRFLRIHYVFAFLAMGVTLVNLGSFFWNGQNLEAVLGANTMEIIFQINQFYAFGLACVFWGLSIKEINNYKQIVTTAFSDQKMLEIRWLWQFIFAILPVLLIWGMILVFILLKRQSYDIVMVVWAAVILFIYFVSYQAFQNKNLFEGVKVPASDALPRSSKKQNDTIITPVISETEDAVLIERIRGYMEEHEPYLEASLSIQDLSEQVEIPVRELSLLINHKLSQHFFDFVNEYRIKKAMDLLKDPTQRKTTVLEILYEVGFNSKSSFNTVFKKFTGKTPTEYRKKNLVFA